MTAKWAMRTCEGRAGHSHGRAFQCGVSWLEWGKEHRYSWVVVGWLMVSDTEQAEDTITVGIELSMGFSVQAGKEETHSAWTAGV